MRMRKQKAQAKLPRRLWAGVHFAQQMEPALPAVQGQRRKGRDG